MRGPSTAEFFSQYCCVHLNFNDSSTVYFLPVSLARTVFLFLLPILPVGLSLIAIQRLGALAFKSLGGGGESTVAGVVEECLGTLSMNFPLGIVVSLLFR